MEKNEFIYSLGDIKLYDHQKNLFTIFKKPENDTIQESAKLVLYIAPTIQQARDISWDRFKKRCEPIVIKAVQSPSLELLVKGAA